MSYLDEILPLEDAPVQLPLEPSDFEAITLPSGITLYYRDSDHSYWRSVKEKNGHRPTGSGRIPGASTATKPVDYRPDALIRWAAKSNGEGISILAREALRLPISEWPIALSFLESEESIWQELTDKKLTYDDLRAARAQEGTNVHELVLHALSKGEPIPKIEETREEEQGYAMAVIDWWQTRQPLPIQSEQVVYSAALGYAGRFDLRARIEEFDETWLVDLKTSGYMALGHHVQLRAYDVAAVESGIGGSDRLLILQVFEDGTWLEHECQATEEMLINALAVYRDAAELQKLVRAQVNEAKKEKEEVGDG